MQSGAWLLFHAAAGGVGLIAGQWGRALGARMIGVARGPVRCALALDHGYEVVLDRAREDVAVRVKELTGGAGVPVVYDSVGQATFEQSTTVWRRAASSSPSARRQGRHRRCRPRCCRSAARSNSLDRPW